MGLYDFTCFGIGIKKLLTHLSDFGFSHSGGGGFRISQRSGRQPQRWGCQPIILVNFSLKSA